LSAEQGTTGDLERQVDAIFAAYDKRDSAGCALGIIRDGNFVYSHTYGMASVELRSPLTPQSVFYMGSVSKQFTAASVVLAAEQGYLLLDDDLRKWIPEIPFYERPITLREMLHHTSGLRDEIGLISLSGRYIEDVHPTAEIVALIARQKELNFPPGEEYQYSNSNYFLLAEVVHRATSMPFSQFAEQNIFRPLGMTHSRFYDDRTLVLPNRVAAYSPRDGGGFSVDWSTNFEKVGDGGLMSTVDDQLLWDRNFYANKLGKGTLLRELQTRGVLNNGKPIDYALGLEMGNYRGLPTVEHGGALFGYRTELLRFPEQKFSVVCLCNLSSADPGGKARQIADVYLARTFREPQKAANPATAGGSERRATSDDLHTFAGLYRNPSDRSLVEVAVRDGKLAVRNALVSPTTPTAAATVLTATAPDRFVDPKGVEYSFETWPNGMRMTWVSAGQTPHLLDRIEPVHPSSAELAAYAGDYYSDELQATYEVQPSHGALIIAIGWNTPIALQPTLRDEFYGQLPLEFRDPIVMQFVRDGGAVSGFDMFAGFADGVRKIRFMKKD